MKILFGTNKVRFVRPVSGSTIFRVRVDVVPGIFPIDVAPGFDFTGKPQKRRSTIFVFA